MMTKTALIVLTLLAIGGFCPTASANTHDCTIVIDGQTSATLYEAGDCDAPRTPQSTFKIPLAVMGFDSGILKTGADPVWKYEPGFTLNRAEDKIDTNPARWEKESVVWYSQKLTRHLGAEKFKAYVNEFNYGNRDVNGDPGKNNGLTHAWLSSSLKISPREQTAFLQKLLSGGLPVSDKAAEQTRQIMPAFTAGDWHVHGKTGTGFQRNPDGSLNKDRQTGWFVGWANNNNQNIIFAHYIQDDKKQPEYAGLRARKEFLKALPGLHPGKEEQ